MGEKFNIIFTTDDMKRVTIRDAKHVEVDVHQMTKREAKRFIKNIIVLNKDEFLLTVIHGYNGGHAIKSMLAKKQIHPRITTITPARNNQGITNLNVVHA